jgi:CelD/BcsL family acetyltransferase involved in cellulose biosynthesis
MTVSAVAPLAARRSPALPLEVSVASGEQGLLELEADWNRLSAVAEDPFSSFDWTRTWWECFGGTGRLKVVVVRDGDGEALALLPMVANRLRRYGFSFSSLGSPWNPHTPRLEPLVADRTYEVCQALWEALERRAGRWDVLQLPQLPADSIVLRHLAPIATARGCRIDTAPGSTSPYVPIETDWATYLGSRSAKHRENLRRVGRHLEALGETRLEVVDGGAGLERALDDGFRLEAAAWKGAAGSAILCRAEVEAFYRRLARRAAERGWLELQFLTVGGRRIAFGFSLRYHQTLYTLKVGYEPEFGRYSPGMLLMAKALESAFDRGLRAYDLLGETERWKRAWTDSVRPHRWLFAFRPSPRARLLHLMKFRLAPHLRRDGRERREVGDAPL